MEDNCSNLQRQKYYTDSSCQGVQAVHASLIVERNDMKANHKQVEKARILLNATLVLLEENKEENWSRGIRAAYQELAASEGTVAGVEFENARSIYNTMTAGGRGFCEYYIWVEDEEERIRRNKTLDELRREVWETFNP